MDLAILPGIYKNPDKTNPNYASLAVLAKIISRDKSLEVVCTSYIRERPLFMARVGAERKVLFALKKALPYLLKSNFLFPTEGKQ